MGEIIKLISRSPPPVVPRTAGPKAGTAANNTMCEKEKMRHSNLLLLSPQKE
jgi:hypothetical protein